MSYHPTMVVTETRSWVCRTVTEPLLRILQRCTDPRQLAFSATLGVILGVFPICGVTAILCGLAIALLGSKCHAPTIMLANFIATPFEWSLVVPFLRFGENISGGEHFPLTSDALWKVVSGQASKQVLLAVLHALIGWLVAAPFFFGVLYALFLPLFKFLVRKFVNESQTDLRLPLASSAKVMFLWVSSFWLVGSWILPFLAHAAGFSNGTLTYREQTLYSLLNRYG